MSEISREDELEETTPAALRAIAMRLGKAFRTPRTKAECRELMAWILAAEARTLPYGLGGPDPVARLRGDEGAG